MRHIACILLALNFARPAIVMANDTTPDLRGVVSDIARDVKKLLDAKGEVNVGIGRFAGPANFPTSSGSGIAFLLAEEMEKIGLRVNDRAKFRIQGTYRFTEVPATNLDDQRLGRKVVATELTVHLVDHFDKVVSDTGLKRTIRGDATVVYLFGLSVPMLPSGPQSDERERDRAIRSSISDSNPLIRDNAIRSRAGSPYAMEVLVSMKACPLADTDGQVFASIKPGEEYSIRLLNESLHETAVQLRIDGLSTFAFSELREPDKIRNDKGMEVANPKRGEPLYSVVFIPPKRDGKPGEAIIRGWHIHAKSTDAFVPVRYAKRAPAWLSHTNDLGTITATFQAAWEKDAPADEPGKRRCGTGDTIGRGYRDGEATMRRLGVIRDCVSVRYTK